MESILTTGPRFTRMHTSTVEWSADAKADAGWVMDVLLLRRP